MKSSNNLRTASKVLFSVITACIAILVIYMAAALTSEAMADDFTDTDVEAAEAFCAPLKPVYQDDVWRCVEEST